MRGRESILAHSFFFSEPRSVEGLFLFRHAPAAYPVRCALEGGGKFAGVGDDDGSAFFLLWSERMKRGRAHLYMFGICVSVCSGNWGGYFVEMGC